MQFLIQVVAVIYTGWRNDWGNELDTNDPEDADTKEYLRYFILGPECILAPTDGRWVSFSFISVILLHYFLLTFRYAEIVSLLSVTLDTESGSQLTPVKEGSSGASNRETQLDIYIESLFVVKQYARCIKWPTCPPPRPPA